MALLISTAILVSGSCTDGAQFTIHESGEYMTTAPPPNYAAQTGTWGTDFDQSAGGLSNSGTYSIEFIDNGVSGTTPKIRHGPIVLSGGVTHRITTTMRADSIAAGDKVKIEIVVLHLSPTPGSNTYTIHDDVLSAADAWEFISYEFASTSTQRFIYVDVTKYDTAFTAWLDSVKLDTIGPRFSAYADTGAATTLAAGSTTKVLFTTEAYDIGGLFASSRFTAIEYGFYHFDASVGIDGGPSGTRYFIQLNKNGSGERRGNDLATTSAYPQLVVAADIELDIGDYVEVFVWNGDGSTIDTTESKITCYFNGHKI